MNDSRDGSLAAGQPRGAAVAGLATAMAVTAETAAAKEVSPALAAVFEKIPAQNAQQAAEIGDALVAGGADIVRQLVGLVGSEFGDSAGAMPKQALHALVIYASRPGADKQRGTVASTLAQELAADHSDELKAFVTRQLQLCGRAQEVPALARLLTSDRLCEPSAQALLAIGGDAARDSLNSALPQADGGRKATISQAVELLSTT